VTNTVPQDILSHTEGRILTLTFNRFEKKNSITAAMYQQLADALAAAKDDVTIRVVVLQGHEAIFSAGNDLGEFLNSPPAGGNSPVFQFLAQISQFPKPIVAAVCGPAVGIGTTLLLHCDLVIAGDNAAFSMPFVNLGLCPEAASSLLVPQMMGYHRAAEALLLGEPIQAEAALEVGLVNRVVPPSEATRVAMQWAQKLAAKPISSLIETKRLLKKTSATQITERMAEEGTSFGRMLREPAAKEAFTAFMERRVPDFSKV
jgi:enoyl-CoA hydratase/carnithine racemase